MKKFKMFSFHFYFSILLFFLCLCTTPHSYAEQPQTDNAINKLSEFLWGEQKEILDVTIKEEQFLGNLKNTKVYTILVKDKKTGNIVGMPTYAVQLNEPGNVFVLGDIFVVKNDRIDAVTWQKKNDFFLAQQKEMEEKLKKQYSTIDKAKLIKLGTGKEKNEVIMFASLMCPHCQDAFKRIINEKLYQRYDTTFYIVLMGDLNRISQIICSKNKEKTMLDIINSINSNSENTTESVTCSDANSINDYYNTLFSKLAVEVVPTFVTPKCVIKGFPPDFEKRLKECQ